MGLDWIGAEFSIDKVACVEIRGLLRREYVVMGVAQTDGTTGVVATCGIILSMTDAITL